MKNLSRLKIIVCSLIIAAVAFFAGVRIYYSLTDDFRLANIRYDTPNRVDREVPLLSEVEAVDLNKILSQKFTYIGKGSQSYAFGTIDGEYVIKFFKFKHLKPSIWLELLPPIFSLQSYKEKQNQRKERKLASVFSGYRLAYVQHKQDSALIFVHLNQTKNLYPSLTVLDKMGWEHSIPLDDVVFIVQRRAETAKTVIHNHLKKRDVAGAKSKIDQIFDLYLSEYAKGIFDNDHAVMRNVGFVKERPIRIDVGKLKDKPAMSEKSNYAADLIIAGDRMIASLDHHEKQDFQELKAFIESRISQIIDRPYTYQAP
jgi:hypothetical protein